MALVPTRCVAPAKKRPIAAGRTSGALRMPVIVAKSTKGSTSTSTTSKTQSGKAKEGSGEVGFRFDPANNRWVRDDRYAGLYETTAKPKSGAEYTVWPACHTYLVSKGLKGVSCERAAELQAQGWTIADVRVSAEFERCHAEGAINLPLYRYVEGKGFWDNVKKATMAIGFAMRATERDPDYIPNCLKKVSKGQKLLLMCNIGGSLETVVNLRPDKYPNGIKDVERAFGRESRSLKAAYELMQAGWSASNLMFVDGGLGQWRYDGLPIETGLDGLDGDSE